MTFTEAAVEVLRRAGKPLHFKDIADLACQGSLLSHVGQDPEVTMGQRLAAMAKREEDRKVVAVAPEGTFALLEWNVAPETIVEPVAPPLSPPEPAEMYRPREREPRAINPQARKRMQELQAEHEPGSVLGEEQAKEAAEERERLAAQKKDRGQRRFGPPAEIVFEWLAQRQSGAALKEMAESLLSRNQLSESLTRDLPSLVAALLEDNRRRTEAGRKPAFIVDGDRVTLVEFPPAPALGELSSSSEGRSPHSGLGRPPTGAQLLAETRRAVVRALRRRTADMDTAAFEHLCGALLEKMGMRDVRVAKRGKEGPLYLARQRRGVSDLRVAVRLVRGQREISRGDVQELRKDLAHYSSQMGIVLAPGEASREARAEASAAGQPPVALYAGDALAEEMVALRVGVSVQVVELIDMDEAFFAAALRGGQPSREEQRRAPREMRDGRPADEARDEHAAPQAEGRASANAEPREAPKVEPRPAAAEAVEASATEVTAAAPAAPGVEGAEAQPGREGGEGRGRRPKREERDREPRRPALPSEQAWGQPAGTPRRPGVPFAPLPGELQTTPGSSAQESAAPAEAAVQDPLSPASSALVAADPAADPDQVAAADPAPVQAGSDAAAAESGTQLPPADAGTL